MVRSLAPVDLVIVGPTAAGKSRLAVEWARSHGGEIVSADSRQVYRGLSIGTGTPTIMERRGIPHHLLDLCSPTEVFSAGDFVRHAREAIGEIQDRGKRVVLCGGTGLYLSALRKGLVAIPSKGSAHQEAFRERLANDPTPVLHERLNASDPSRAREIHPNDRVRVLRALYLMEEFALPPSDLYAAHRGEGLTFQCLVGLWPGRETLHARIASRVRRMMEDGWVSEVRTLLDSGVPEEAPGFNSLGYRDILDVLSGRTCWEGLEERIVLRTRQYAKRQMTWFRHMEGVGWIDGPEEERRFLEADPNYAKIKTISHHGC